jgi:hypothetical protein
MTEAQADAVLARGCEGKTAYSPKTAKQVAVAFTQYNPPGEPPVAAYRCVMCGRWHVGHMVDTNNLASIAEAMRVANGCAPGAPAHNVPRRERKRLRRAQHA